MSNKVPQIRFNGYSDAWEERKLGDITTWTKGQGLSKEYLNNERYGSEAVHYADLYKFSPVMQEVIHWTNSDDGRIIPDNSLLFPASDVTPVGLARTSTLRLSGVKAGGDVIIGQLSERINSSFMSYQINANSKKILPLITGTTVKHVQAKSLATMSVTITNMAEQTAISGLFERIDNLIALHQRKLDLLKEQKKGYLQKMFPKNGAKVPELRFAGFADDWEQRKLGEMLINLEAGVSVNSSDYETGYFILKTSAIKQGNVDSLEVKSVVQEEVSKVKTPLIKNSIIISRMNTPELVGASGIVRESIDNIFLPDRLWQGQVAENFSSEWLIQSINIASNIQKIRDLATGTSGSMKNISKRSILDLIINVPKLKEQKQIGSFFKQLDDTIILHQRKLDLLKEQKKGYLQKMFV